MIYEKTVPDQLATNLMQFTSKETPEIDYVGVQARHTATVSDISGIRFVGLDGVTYDASLGAYYDDTNKAGLLLALSNAIKGRRASGGMGCLMRNDNYDKGGIEVTVDGTDVRVTIDCDVTITHYLNGVTANAVARYTTLKNVQRAYIELPTATAIGDLQLGATKSALGSFTVAATLETAIDGALTAVGATVTSNTVVLNGSIFEVTIETEDYPLSFAGEKMKNLKTYTGYFNGSTQILP